MTGQELAGLQLPGKDLGAVVAGRGREPSQQSCSGRGRQTLCLAGQAAAQAAGHKKSLSPCSAWDRPQQQESWLWEVELEKGTSWRTVKVENLADKDG